MLATQNFRLWCREKWYEHVDEIIDLTGREPAYTSQQYFSMYCWWLKREYQHQVK
jgi:hypothetical protein